MPKNTDMVAYKLEMIEKRLDLIEQMLYNRGSGSGSGGNQDVVALLMNIIKDQMASRPASTATAATAAATSTGATAGDKEGAECSKDDTDSSVLKSASSTRRRFTIGM